MASLQNCPAPAGTSLVKLVRDEVATCVDPFGAQLVNLQLAGTKYRWQGDSRWWARRAPVLFPIVGALGGATVSAAGPVSLGCHELARDMPYRVVDLTATSATFELASSPETMTRYPFEFSLRTSYALVGPATIEQRFAVGSTGDVPLPYVVGGHPAFNVPLPGTSEEDFGDWRLEFAQPWTADVPTIVEGGLLDFAQPVRMLGDMVELELAHELIETRDTLVFHNVPGRAVALVGALSCHGVRLTFDGFDYLGVWSAAGNAPFVAVEPWTGCATALDEGASFEAKRRMRLLDPGKTDVRAFTIELF